MHFEEISPDTREAWLGNCLLRERDGTIKYHCQASVWTDSIDGFHDVLESHLESTPYALEWLEQALRAPHYVRQHFKSPRLEALRSAVSRATPVVLGRMVRVNGSAGELRSEDLEVRTLPFDPLEDMSKVAFWDRPWIAPGLKELLFDAPGVDDPMHTYLLVDAGLRAKVVGLFDLDTDPPDVPIQCLFRGEAAIEYKDVAPYLIDLTLPETAWDDPEKVPAFHRGFFADHQNVDTGYIIRSSSTLEEVVRHFRKFTRVRMQEDDRWVYFRFDDPRSIGDIVRALEPEDLHRFLGHHRLVVLGKAHVQSFSVTKPMEDPERANLPPFTMKPAYISAAGDMRRRQVKDKVHAYLSEHASGFSAKDKTEQSRILDTLLIQALQYGFRIEQATADFALASVLHGQSLDNDPTCAAIIRSDKHQIDKARLMVHEMIYRASGNEE